MSSPQTRICICQTLGLSNDYRHTFWFDNVADQTDFFESKVIKTFVNYAYVRKNWSLKVNASITDAEKWGYLFFQNFPTGRYYYYFITNVKYISDETVELELEMDVMQTYFFDYALQPSFVEREHASSDIVGENTLDEELELGQHITDGTYSSDVFSGDMSVLLMSTVDINGDDFPACYGKFTDGLYSGCNIYAVKADVATTAINSLLKNLGSKADAIICMWQYPEELLQFAGKLEGDNPYFDTVVEGKTDGVDFLVNRPNDFDGYTPKNSKLLTYPYNYIYMTNNIGNSAIYRYERFQDGIPLFQLDGSPFPDGGVKCTPRNYNGVGFNYDESLNLTGFPTCAWNADAYKIWLAQNQGQHTGQILGGIGGIVAGGVMMLTGAGVLPGAGVMAGGVTSIFSHLSQRHDMESHPPQARGSISATLNTSLGQHRITAYRKVITRERAEIIDNFFTMYGYKTLRVKTPNRNVRQSFTYTKTSGCLLTGSLCQEDARKIQSIYDNGITFWQSSVLIGNYSASNAVK